MKLNVVYVQNMFENKKIVCYCINILVYQKHVVQDFPSLYYGEG